MTSQVARMYASMVGDHLAPLHPAMQRRIKDFAAGSGDTGLVAALIARKDIDPEIELELSRSSDLEVLSAWASSPRRSSEELAERLGSEKRVGALLALARRGGLPSEVYRMIASRGSVKLSEALLDNSSTPHDVRVDALRFLVSRPTWGSSSTQHRLRSWISSEAEARACVESVVDLQHLRSVAESPHVPDDCGDELVAALERTSSDWVAGGEGWWGASSVSAILSVIRSLQVSEDARERCLAMVEVMDSRIPSDHWSRRDMAPDRLREAFGGESDGFDATLRSLSEPGVDLEHATARLSAMAKDRTDIRIAFDAASKVKGVPDRFFRDHIADASMTGSSQMFETLLSEGRLELLCELSFGSGYFSSSAVQALQRSPYARALVEMVAAASLEREAAMPAWAKAALQWPGFEDIAISVMPWPELSDMAHRFGSDASAGRITKAVQDHLMEEFGDDEELWRVFSELGSSFRGSLTTLTETVRMVRE